MTTDTRTLRVELTVDGEQQAANALNRVDRNVKEVGRSTERMTAAMKGAAGAIGALVAGAGLAALRQQITFADELGKTADALGTSTEFLSEYQRVLALSGVESRKFETALQQQAIRLAEAEQGTGQAVDALERLGITQQEIADLNTEEEFNRIVEAMQGVEDSAERVALANDLWGRSGVELVRVVNSGTEAIAEMRAEAQAAGESLSEEQTRDAAEFNDAVERLTRSFTALGTQLALALAGPLTDLANFFTSIVSGALAAARSIREWAVSIGIMAAAVGELTGAEIRREIEELEGELERLQDRLDDDSFFGALSPRQQDITVRNIENTKDRIEELNAALADTETRADEAAARFQNLSQGAVQPLTIEVNKGADAFKGLTEEARLAAVEWETITDQYADVAAAQRDIADNSGAVTQALNAETDARNALFAAGSRLLSQASGAVGDRFAGDALSIAGGLAPGLIENGFSGLSNSQLFAAQQALQVSAAGALGGGSSALGSGIGGLIGGGIGFMANGPAGMFLGSALGGLAGGFLGNMFGGGNDNPRIVLETRFPGSLGTTGAGQIGGGSTFAVGPFGDILLGGRDGAGRPPVAAARAVQRSDEIIAGLIDPSRRGEATAAALTFAQSTQEGAFSLDEAILQRTTTILDAVGGEVEAIFDALAPTAESIGTVLENLGNIVELNAASQALATSWDATNEAFSAGVSALEEIERIVGIDDVFGTAQAKLDELARGPVQVLLDQADSVNALTAAYDGSIDATRELAQGLVDLEQAQLAALAATRAAREGVEQSSEDALRSIDRLGLSGTDLFNFEITRANELSQVIDTLSDPAEIERTVQEINRASLAALGAISSDPELLAARREEVRQLIEESTEAAQAQLDVVEQSIVDATTEAAEFTKREMGSAADDLRGAASDISAAARRIQGPPEVNLVLEGSLVNA